MADLLSFREVIFASLHLMCNEKEITVAFSFTLTYKVRKFFYYGALSREEIDFLLLYLCPDNMD
jgi:hypothetical protein